MNFGFLRKIFRDRAKDWFYNELAPSQTPGNKSKEKIEAGQKYVNIWLKSMRIVDIRQGLSKFYPAVHSFIRLSHSGGGVCEFNVVSTPSNLQELDADNIDEVIQVNKRLLGPIPYTGGDIDIEIGLFSIKSADLAQPYLTLLQDISDKAGVAFVNQALQFAEPLKKGINLIIGGNDETQLEIGLSKTFSETELETGYNVVMRVEKDKIDEKTIRIEKDTFKVTDSVGNLIRDYPYLVFEIEVTDNKSNWKNIPELKSAHENLKNLIQQQNVDFNAVDESLKVFRRTVLFSYDLIKSDARKIYAEVEKDVKEVMGSTTVSSGNGRNIRSLDEIDI